MNVGVNATRQLPLQASPVPEIHRECTALAPVRTLLRWKVPEVVAESPHLESAVRLCELMARHVEERGVVGTLSKAHSKSWVLAMEKLLRLDGRTPEQVAKVLCWLDRGADDVSDFWQANVLCPSKLRLRWATMELQYVRLRRRQVGGRRQGLAEATGVDSLIRRTLDENGRPGLTSG
jgi:hypothetical protein